MNSNTRYNPADAGQAVNEQPHRTFYPITEDDRQRARDRLQALLDYTRRTLDPLSADNED